MGRTTLAVVASKIEDMHSDIRDIKSDVKKIGEKTIVQEIRITSLEKTRDSMSSKAWAVILLVVGAVATAIVNVWSFFNK